MAAYPAIRFTPRHLSGVCGVSLLSGSQYPDMYRQRLLTKKIFHAEYAEIADFCRHGIVDAIFCEYHTATSQSRATEKKSAESARSAGDILRSSEAAKQTKNSARKWK